jgi:hypothetical protein
MVNSGSILTNALLQTLMKPEMSLAEKFDYVNDYVKVSDILLGSNANLKSIKHIERANITAKALYTLEHFGMGLTTAEGKSLNEEQITFL